MDGGHTAYGTTFERLRQIGCVSMRPANYMRMCLHTKRSSIVYVMHFVGGHDVKMNSTRKWIYTSLSAVVSKLKSTYFSHILLFHLQSHHQSPFVVGRPTTRFSANIYKCDKWTLFTSRDNRLFLQDIYYSDVQNKRIRQFGFDVLRLRELKVHFSLCPPLASEVPFLSVASQIQCDDHTNKYLLICWVAYTSATPQHVLSFTTRSSVVCANEGASDIYTGKIVCKMRRILVSEIDLYKIQHREDRAIERKSVVATCLS